MAAIIIRKKDIDKLAKETLNEVFNFFHNEYIINTFPEIKIVKNNFLKSLALNHINTLNRQYKITQKERDELVKPFIGKNTEYDPNLEKEAMKDKGIDTEGIYYTLFSIKLEMEIDENLYFKVKAFLNLFNVFESDYSYLEY